MDDTKTGRDFTKDPVQIGSAPIPPAEKPLPPAEKPLRVSPEDDPIVQHAAKLYEEGVEKQVNEIQARGHQKGFTKASLDEIVDK